MIIIKDKNIRLQGDIRWGKNMSDKPKSKQLNLILGVTAELTGMNDFFISHF